MRQIALLDPEQRYASACVTPGRLSCIRGRPTCGVTIARLTSVEQRAGQSVEQITTDFDRDRWLTAPEAAAYGLAEEVIDGPAETPESGAPA